MNLHEQIDYFYNKSTRTKRLIIFSVLTALAVFCAFVFYLGFSFGHGWADSDYLQEREKTLQKVQEYETKSKIHDENERQLLVENNILKRVNEANAEVLRANDAKIRGDMTKLDELNQARTEKLAEIKSDDDYFSQVRGLCQDYRAQGQELSFCSRFEEK